MTDPIAERKMPLGRVHTVRGALYFWVPSGKTTVRIGMRVPKYTAAWRMHPGYYWDKGRAAENFIEDVRQDEFASLPSRLGNVFVCPTEGGFCADRSERSGADIYAVSVTGRVFHTDSSLFNDVAEHVSNSEYHLYRAAELTGEDARHHSRAATGAREEALAAARRYWRGSNNWGGKEAIVDGVVTVLGPVTDVRAESRRRPQGVLIERGR